MDFSEHSSHDESENASFASETKLRLSHFTIKMINKKTCLSQTIPWCDVIAIPSFSKTQTLFVFKATLWL